MPHLFYPAKGILRGQWGLNLADYLLNVDARHTLNSKDVYFWRRTPRRRRGFTRLSTEDWSGAVFKGGCEFLDDYGNARLLVGRNGGTIEEIQSAAAHGTPVAGLTAGQDIRFVTGFGSCWAVNGADALRRIDATSNPAVACTSRKGGIPDIVTNFTAVAGAAGGRTGSYAFMATAVIESGGLKLLESDWSDLVEVTVAAKAITFGWTNPAIADARVTHVYLYGTKAGGIEPYYITKVALPATGLVNNDTADSALGALASRRGGKTTAPAAPTHVEISGTRLILGKGKTVYFSRPGINSYDLEGFQAQVDLQIPGMLRAMKTIAATGQAVNSNSLWVATDRACVLFIGSDPTTPQTLLSSEVGAVGPEAVAVRGKYLFWVDKRRGVMFWPGEGRDIYCVSQNIQPVFSGGGNQNLTANQGDENITLSVWGDMLTLTIRDDSSKVGANKVYQMDLIGFEEDLLRQGPEGSAVWGGPWANGLGYHRLIPRADGGLTVLDNQQKAILKWDTTTFKDYVAGASVIAQPVVRFGPALQETLEENKRLSRFYLFVKHGPDSKLRVVGEEGRFDYPGITLKNSGYPDLEVLDGIPLIDIAILKDSGRSEAAMDWSFLASWFQFEVYTEDGDNDWQLAGIRVTYTRQKVMINV
jgi:hypothetical protein